MKISTSQAELHSLLERVALHVAHTGPLSRVVLNAREGKVNAVGGNDDVSIRATMACEVESPGAIAIPAAALRQYVANLPPGRIVIDATSGGKLQVLSEGGASASINSVSASEYPEPVGVSYQGVTLPAEVVHAAADWVAFAASADQDRPIFTGVSFRVVESKSEFMATDGHRLARAAFLVSGGERGLDLQAVIPVKSLEATRRLLDPHADFDIGVSPEGASHLGFRQDGVEIIARAIDGSYPPVEKFIPSHCAIMAVVDRQAFLNVLNRMVVLTNNKTRSVDLRVQNGQILFKSYNYDLGEASDQLQAKTEGGDIEISVNGEHLSRMIAKLPEGRVVLGFDSPEKPILIRPSRESLVDSWTLDYILMPLRPIR